MKDENPEFSRFWVTAICQSIREKTIFIDLHIENLRNFIETRN